MAVVEQPVMLIDQSLCVGCEACTTVCKSVYGVSTGVFRTKIDREETGVFPSVKVGYNKRACQHCREAACVMACPTRALQKTPDKLTVLDQRLCITCNYCVANCPYGAINYDRSTRTMEKCDLCLVRIRDGLQPLCVEVCTSRVIEFGERSRMIAKAKERRKRLLEQGYANATIYGEEELGGLQVITVLSDAPQSYGLPPDPRIPLGLRLWRMIPLTPAVLVAAGLVMGTNYLHTRFMERTKQVALEQGKKNTDASEKKVDLGGDAS